MLLQVVTLSKCTINHGFHSQVYITGPLYIIILWMFLQAGRSLDELDHFYPGNTTCRGGSQRTHKNAEKAANRQQKWWNCTLDLLLEGLETLSVSKSKMENRWNEHMIKFEWVESLLAQRAAREAGWKNKSEQIAPETSSQCSSDHFSSQFPRVFSRRIFIPQMHRCSQFEIFYLLHEVEEGTISNLVSNDIRY